MLPQGMPTLEMIDVYKNNAGKEIPGIVK